MASAIHEEKFNENKDAPIRQTVNILSGQSLALSFLLITQSEGCCDWVDE